MPRHHLVTRDSVGDGVHDGPLRRSDPPSPLGFFLRQLDHFGPAQIGFERSVVYKDAAPNDLTRFAHSLDRPAAEPEIHRGLALADRAGIATNEVVRRH